MAGPPRQVIGEVSVENIERAGQLADRAVRMVARPAASNHPHPSPDPCHVFGLGPGPGDALHRLGDRPQAVDARPTLAGGLRGKEREYRSRLDDATAVLRKDGHHPAPERCSVQRAEAFRVEGQTIQSAGTNPRPEVAAEEGCAGRRWCPARSGKDFAE